MNILLINHYAGSPNHGMEYRPYYLAREWVKNGHNVCIVASSFSHLHSRSPEIKEKGTRDSIDGIQYLWIKSPEYKGNGISRVINMSSFSISLFKQAKKLSTDFKPDLVIASSPHPFVIFGANRIARYSNSQLIFEVRDLWPLTLIELGSLSKYHPFIAMMQYAENYAYRVSDKIISLLPSADDYMCKHGMSRNKFGYVPNGINIEEWNNCNDSLPPYHKEVLQDIKQKGHFIVGYAGAHGLANALGYLLNAAELLKDQPVSFVLVGHGDEKENLQEYALNKALNNVFFLSSVPKSTVPLLLSLMDILYIGWLKHPLYRFGVSPNKLFDYMMAAKPIIHSIEAGNDIVGESGCGLSVIPEEPRAIADAVKQLMQMREHERNAMGEKGKAYVIGNHDYKVLARKFLSSI